MTGIPFEEDDPGDLPIDDEEIVDYTYEDWYREHEGDRDGRLDR